MSILDTDRLDVLNVGLTLFADAVKDQNTPVLQVDWQPEAGGNLELLRVIDWLEANDIHDAA